MANHTPAVVAPDEGRVIKVIGLDVTIKLSSVETGGDYYIFQYPMYPGDEVPMHTHEHEDELIEVLEGKLEFTIGDNTSSAEAGALAFFPRNIPHTMRNPFETTAQVRVTVTPGKNFETFFEELSSLPSDGPPDMPKVAEIFSKYGIPIAH